MEVIFSLMDVPVYSTEQMQLNTHTSVARTLLASAKRALARENPTLACQIPRSNRTHKCTSELALVLACV